MIILRPGVDAGMAVESVVAEGVSWPNMSALLGVSWAKAAIAVMASATAVKLLVNLNIGLGGDGAWTRLKQPAILPDSNGDGKPFVVCVSMQFVVAEVKFGIFATVKTPLRWGIGKSAKSAAFIYG